MLPLVKNDPWLEPVSKAVEKRHNRYEERLRGTLEDDFRNQVYPMPLYTAGKDDVYVGRVRKDLANENGITLWLSGDQIKKGAALNAVQIAEYLVSQKEK